MAQNIVTENVNNQVANANEVNLFNNNKNMNYNIKTEYG